MIKILAIDDKLDNLITLSALLKSLIPDISVLTAQSGLEGIEKAKAEMPDTILLDIIMPGMDGFEVCQQLKSNETTKRIPVIMLTAIQTNSHSRIKGLELGADAFLAKPIDEAELVAQVKVALRIKQAEDQLRQEKNHLQSIVEERTKALGESEQLYQSVFNAAETFLIVNLDGMVVEANPAACEMYGYSRESLINMPMKKLIHPAYNHLIGESKEQIKSKKQFFSSAVIICKDGSRRHVEVRKISFLFQGATHLLIAVRDLTERKKAEEMLRNERNFINAVLDTARALIVVCDKDGKIDRFNKACEKLSGYSFEEVHDHCIWELLPPPQEQELVKEKFAQLLKTEFFLSTEYHWQTKQGEQRLISWNKSYFYDNVTASLHVVSIGIDISKERQAQQEAERQREQLIQTDKLSSLGVLVAGVAHEINNPNSFIMLNIPILENIWQELVPILDKYQSTGEDFSLGSIPYSTARERVPILISAVREGSQRIKDIVTNLKDFARQDVSGMDQKVAINEAVRSSVTLTQNQIKKATHYFVLECAARLPAIRGNFQRLEQVIINLIINACEALPDSQKQISLTTALNEEQNHVLVQVKDEGIGMPADVLKNIKDPFFTTKRELGGTGLGLSISDSIIQEHGGTLTFESCVGQGTTATITLPIFQDSI